MSPGCKWSSPFRRCSGHSFSGTARSTGCSIPPPKTWTSRRRLRTSSAKSSSRSCFGARRSPRNASNFCAWHLGFAPECHDFPGHLGAAMLHPGLLAPPGHRAPAFSRPLSLRGPWRNVLPGQSFDCRWHSWQSKDPDGDGDAPGDSMDQAVFHVRHFVLNQRCCRGKGVLLGAT